MLHVIAYLANVTTALAWIASYFAAGGSGPWREDSPAARLNRWICYPSLIGWLAGMVFVPTPLWMNCLNGLWLFAWHWVHKTYHNHKHTRRLLEAGRGLVQRRHNRLVVVPESAS